MNVVYIVQKNDIQASQGNTKTYRTVLNYFQIYILEITNFLS